MSVVIQQAATLAERIAVLPPDDAARLAFIEHRRASPELQPELVQALARVAADRRRADRRLLPDTVQVEWHGGLVFRSPSDTAEISFPWVGSGHQIRAVIPRVFAELLAQALRDALDKRAQAERAVADAQRDGRR